MGEGSCVKGSGNWLLISPEPGCSEDSPKQLSPAKLGSTGYLLVQCSTQMGHVNGVGQLATYDKDQAESYVRERQHRLGIVVG